MDDSYKRKSDNKFCRGCGSKMCSAGVKESVFEEWEHVCNTCGLDQRLSEIRCVIKKWSQKDVESKYIDLIVDDLNRSMTSSFVSSMLTKRRNSKAGRWSPNDGDNNG